MEENLKGKANFFIVGTAKAGTTSVFNYLKEHPDVFTPIIKEPNFFAKIDSTKFSNTFKKNLPKSVTAVLKAGEETQQAFIERQEDYDFMFKSCVKKVAIDSSTNYLHSEYAAKEIKDYNPEAKILIILRDPYKRVLSHYNMAVKFGFTTLSFEEALKKDITQEPKGVGQSEQFIELSLYHDAIKRYIDAFELSQVKVAFFEDLISDKQKFMTDLFSFLDIKDKSIEDEKIHNKTNSPKFKHLNKALTNLGVKRFANSFLSGGMKDKLKKIYFTDNLKKELNEEERELLEKYFEEDVRKTKELLKDLNFPW